MVSFIELRNREEGTNFGEKKVSSVFNMVILRSQWNFRLEMSNRQSESLACSSGERFGGQYLVGNLKLWIRI